MTRLGTKTNPFSINQAVRDEYNIIYPGDTVLLKGGVYDGEFIASLRGMENNKIVVKNVPGNRVIIDGYLWLSQASHVRLQGIEITDSGFTDRATGSGTDGVIPGEGCEIVNCIINNHNQGVAGGSLLDHYLLYGNIIYYNGLQGNKGHGVYCQHQGTGGYAEFINNIVFQNFGFGFHLYGSHPLNNVLIRGNVIFQNSYILNGGLSGSTIGLLMNGTDESLNYDIQDNLTYLSDRSGASFRFYAGELIGNIVIDNNVIMGGSESVRFVSTFAPDRFSGNGVYGAIEEFLPSDYPDNVYEKRTAVPDAIYLQPNLYDENRAHLTVYNVQEQADSIGKDVSSVFSAGDSIKAHNAQDYFNDIQNLTVAGDGTITVDMQAVNRTVETPVGWDAPATTFPQFGCFVLERV